MKLSAVVPVFNEAPVLPEFYRRLVSATRDDGHEWTFVFVDDGSTDQSLDLLRGLASADRRVQVLSLARNFGHQAAITAGIDHARGDAVIVLDADLQDPPELIPDLIARWQSGYDVVYAVRRARKESALKRFAYRAFYWLLSRIAEVPIHEDSGDFCLMDRRVARILSNMRERNRFVRGIRSWVGFRQIGIEYERPGRAAGETHYSWSGLIKLGRDGFLSFSYVPLRLSLYTGCVGVVGSVILGIWIVTRRLMQPTYVPGVTTNIVLALFFGGLQLFILGLMGEYIGRIYDEVKARPLYLVREYINDHAEAGDLPSRALDVSR